MATFDYTTRELRTKQALILDKADAGEDIIIHRGIKSPICLFRFTRKITQSVTSSERRLQRRGEDYKAGKGVTCKTVEQSMALLESL